MRSFSPEKEGKEHWCFCVVDGGFGFVDGGFGSFDGRFEILGCHDEHQRGVVVLWVDLGSWRCG